MCIGEFGILVDEFRCRNEMPGNDVRGVGGHTTKLGLHRGGQGLLIKVEGSHGLVVTRLQAWVQRFFLYFVAQTRVTL